MLFSRGFSLSDTAQTVERLGVEAIPARERRPKPALHAVETPAPAPVPPAAIPGPPTPAEPIYVTRKPNPSDLIIANLRAVALVLSARALLLMSLVGAFVLGLQAMSWQTPMGLYVLVAWTVLAVLPLVGMEVSGRMRRPPGG